MAEPGGKKHVVTAADLMRFAIIIGLGVLSFITFLFAGTTVVLLAIDSSECCVRYFPVGLAILGILGLIFFIDLIIEAVDAPSVLHAWFVSDERHKQQLILLVISLFAIWLVT